MRFGLCEKRFPFHGLHAIAGKSLQGLRHARLFGQIVSNEQAGNIVEVQFRVSGDAVTENVDILLKAIDVIPINCLAGLHEFNDQELLARRHCQISAFPPLRVTTVNPSSFAAFLARFLTLVSFVNVSHSGDSSQGFSAM